MVGKNTVLAKGRRIITLTTDFGHADPWVGIMKGVMLSINPDLAIVDITHDVPPQDIKKASFCLGGLAQTFPEGTIHICIVDPGVGSKRDPVIIQTGRYFYVGPNNGVFSALDSKVKKTAVIKNKKYVGKSMSATFQGRDLFAPVAAHLATTPIEKFGPPVKKLVKISRPGPRWKRDGSLAGEIVYFDHFGNAYTNITKEMLARFKEKRPTIATSGTEIGGLGFFYRSRRPGTLGAIINGFDLMELFTPDGSARDEFGLKIGDRVVVSATRKLSG
jgi:hypothetical protein